MGNFQAFPLIGPPNESVDDVQTDQSASTLIDAIPLVVEGKLNIVKRPGLVTKIDFGTGLGIDGLFWWDKQRVVLVVSAGRVWKITDQAGTNVELTGSTALQRGRIVTFAGDGSKMAMANGGQIVTTDLTSLTTMADPDAPQAVTHLAELDGYLHANEVGTGRDHFSDINNLTSWQALSFFEAESSPDDLVAMDVAFQEIIALGRESVEFWVDDGVSPFSRIPGATQPYGTEAPYSLAQIGKTWIWLSDRRRLVTMQGRDVVEVSTPYDRLIQRMVAVDDAIGYTVSIDGYPIYVLNFPTAKATLAFNYETGQWHKWGYWDSTRGEYQRYRGQSYCYARAWNQHLVGDYANGIVYLASPNTYTDNGNPIRSVLRTGHVSHGLLGRKRSNCIRLHCKRGVGNDRVADPQIQMRRRVDNKPQWTNQRAKSLGQVGDSKPFIDWRRNGIYKTQQIELVHSDDSEFVVMGAQEDVDPLRN